MEAQHRLFGTYELFESVLLACDAFSILSSIPVCNHWRSVIMASKAVHSHLAAIQPPAWMPNSLATTGTGSGEYRLYETDDTPWCFRTPTPHGTLWVLRIPRAALETCLLVPGSPKNPLLHLSNENYTKTIRGDSRSWRYSDYGRRRPDMIIYGPLLPDLEWRASDYGRVICRAMCKQARRRSNTLSEYLTCFYGDEFEALTGERLPPGTRERWENCCWWLVVYPSFCTWSCDILPKSSMGGRSAAACEASCLRAYGSYQLLSLVESRSSC